jgi:hypothetical protein
VQTLDKPPSVLTELDVIQPLRMRVSDMADAKVQWSAFIGAGGPLPLDLLLEQPSRLVRPGVVVDLSSHRHCVIDGDCGNGAPGFSIAQLDAANGSATTLPEADQPFTPMRIRAEKLEALAAQIEHDNVGSSGGGGGGGHGHSSLWQRVGAALRAICDHYRQYVRLVCDLDPAAPPPPTHTLLDLLVWEEQKHHEGRSYYIGGNATLGGAALNGRYFLVSQRMASLLAQQDTLGQRPTDTSEGTHPTYTCDGMPLFFKATALGHEGSLGTTKEHAMYVLADKLFGRGIARTSLLTIARHTTVDVAHMNKRENRDLHNDIFRPDPDRFLNPTVFDEDPTALEAVKRMQQMHTRVLQVAEKVTGPLLQEVLNDPAVATLDSESVSETVVFTILTTADDAKGDNFIVDKETGRIIGIDNDHVLCDTLIPLAEDTKGQGQQRSYQVHFKNILLCYPKVLDALVHRNVIEKLMTTNPTRLLMEWLGELARHEHRVETLYRDGALPPVAPGESRCVATDTGEDLEFGAQTDVIAARVHKLWARMRAFLFGAGGGGGSCTHRELFHAVLPGTARYYHDVRCHALRDPASVDPDELAEINRRLHHDGCNDADKTLRWLYYQSSTDAPLRDKVPPPVLEYSRLSVAPNEGWRTLTPSQAANRLGTYPQQACRLLAELNIDIMPAEDALQVALAMGHGFQNPETLRAILDASQTALVLAQKLIAAGVTDERLLDVIAWVAQTEASASSVLSRGVGPHGPQPAPLVSRPGTISRADNIADPEGSGSPRRSTTGASLVETMPNYDFLFKIVMAGHTDTGKSSLLSQFVEKEFDPLHNHTWCKSRAMIYRPNQMCWKRQPALRQEGRNSSCT